MWTSLFSEHVRLRSLAAGKPGLEFTMDCHSASAVDAERVVMLGRIFQ